MYNIAGQKFDIFTEAELDGWVEILKKAAPITVRGNDCYAVDENNMLNLWFQKKIFSRIQNLFGKEIKLQFGMFLNEIAPWMIHTDAYHVKPFLDRKPALSMLIPYTVDNRKDLVEKVHTLVFNEAVDDNDSMDSLEDKSQDENSALLIYDRHLSHNRPERVAKLTVQGIYQWKLGSIIYWNSRNLHDSDNFLASGCHSKQAIVIHTYY